jgi:hypothetical protein
MLSLVCEMSASTGTTLMKLKFVFAIDYEDEAVIYYLK